MCGFVLAPGVKALTAGGKVAMEYRYRILGPLDVHTGLPGLVAPQRRKQRVLLGMLLLNANTVNSADTVVDWLWGEQPPKSARANLHSYISGLRRLLAGPQQSEPARLQTRGGFLLRIEP